MLKQVKANGRVKAGDRIVLKGTVTQVGDMGWAYVHFDGDKGTFENHISREQVEEALREGGVTREVRPLAVHDIVKFSSGAVEYEIMAIDGNHAWIKQLNGYTPGQYFTPNINNLHRKSEDGCA